jgi:hypothetical protein
MWMHFAMAGVNHQPLVIRLVDKQIQQLLPYATVTPTAETALRVLPIAKVRRQVSPWRARAHNPKYRIDKQSVV